MAQPKRTKLDFTSGSLDYKGINMKEDALLDDPGWYIWHFVWTSSKLTDIQGPKRGSWNERANLDWI